MIYSLPLLALLFALLLEPSTSFSTNPTSLLPPPRQQTPSQLFLFNFPSSGGGGAKVPTSTANRDSAAISAIKAAIQKPRNPKFTLVECEFPALAALNKLGDGSLRSATEAEDANIAFASKLCSKVGSFGQKVNLVISSSASRSFADKVRKNVKGASICSVKDLASSPVSGVCVFLTPSSKADYQEARKLAEGGCSTVIVNGLFKVSCDNITKCMTYFSLMHAHLMILHHPTNINHTLYSIIDRIKSQFQNQLQWHTFSNP
jgi:hypothetical protein